MLNLNEANPYLITPPKPPSASDDSDSALALISKYESGDRNVPNYRFDPGHTAQGYYQITNTNWRSYGPRAGVDLKQHPSAMAAPREVQASVAKLMHKEQGFAPWAPFNPRLKAALGRGEMAYLITSEQPRSDNPYLTTEDESGTESAQPSVATTKRRIKKPPTVTDALDKLTEYVNNLTGVASRKPVRMGDVQQASRTQYPSLGELRRSEDTQGQPSRVTQTEDELRVMKGEQPGDRQAYSRQQDAQVRLSKMRDESNAEREAREREDRDFHVRSKGEIDSLTKQYRGIIKSSGIGSGEQWTGETLAKGLGGIGELFAGITGAESLKKHSEALQRAAMEEGTDRDRATKLASDVIGGFISSAPELLAMKLGAPPVATFAAGSALRAGAKTSDPMEIANAAEHGGLTGLGFETPGIGEGVKNVVTKALGVGGTTAGLELAQGATPGEALQTGLTNALVTVPGSMGGKRARQASEQEVTPQSGANRAQAEGLEPARTEDAGGDVRRVSPSEVDQAAADQQMIREQFDRLKASTEPQPVHHSNLQPRRARNTETGTKGQFKKGAPIRTEELAPKLEVAESPAVSAVEPVKEDLRLNENPEQQGESNVAQEAVVPSKAVEESAGQGAPAKETAPAPAIKPRRDTSNKSLAQAVRAAGGIKLDVDAANRGELVRLSQKEGATTGLVNNKGGSNAETMALRMAADGYRGDWVDVTMGAHGPKFDVDGNKFLEAIENDQRGITKSYSGDAGFDFEKGYKEHTETQIADEKERRVAQQSADRLVNLLESGRGGELFDKITANEATPAEHKELRELARKSFVRFSTVEDLISEAKAEGLSTSFEGDVQTPRAAEAVTPPAATPELQKHADLAASLRQRIAAPELTALERGAMERKAARLEKKAAGQREMHAGADPYELLDDIIIKGGELYRKAKLSFDEWAEKIRAEFGAESEPHLRNVYAELSGEKPAAETSIKNAAVEADREALGLPELTPAEHKTWQTSLDNARAKGLHDADTTDRIADRVLEGKKKGLDDEESAGLTLRIRELQNKHQELSEKIWTEKDPVKLFELRTDAKAIEDQFNKLSDATKQGGSDVARALAIRRSAVNENYDLVSLKRDFKTATGKEPTGKNLEKIKEQAKEIARLQAELEKTTAEKEAGTSAEVIKKLVRDEQFAQRKQRRTATRKVLDTEAEDLTKQLAAVWKTRPRTGIQPLGGLGTLDPEGIATKLVLKLAKNRVRAGYTTAEGLIDAVHVMIADAVDLTKREVSEMISGYGKTIEMSKDEVDVKLRELKSIIASNLGKADVIEQGIRPLRRGLQRDKPTQDVRQAARELRDALREHGIEIERAPQSPEDQQKSLMDAAKTSTRNRIEDLKKWIKDGKRTVANKTEIIPDAELSALRKERDDLTEIFKAIDDPLADQQKIDNAMKAIEKSIGDLESRIKLGEIVPKLRQASSPWSPEIAAARRSQAALRGILSDLRAANRKANQPPVDPFEAEARKLLNAEKSFRKRAESQIADMEKRIQVGDYSNKPKRTQRKLSPDEQKLKDQLEAEKNRYQNLKRRNSPGAWWTNASGMRKAWLLSWLKTHVRNIGGTGLYQPFDEVARLPAVIVDAALSPVTGQRGIQGPSPIAMIDSVLHAARVGGREAVEILKQGATREDMERHQYQEINTGVKVVDTVHNAIFRFMSASDRVFYQGAYRRNLLDRTYIEAKNEARSDPKVNVKQRAKDLSDSPTPELDAAAKHDALVNTFNNNNAFSDAIKRARSRFDAKTNFAIDMVMPFDRTPTNVIARIIEASPVGLVKAATGGYKKSPYKVAKDIVTKAMTVEEQRQFSQTIGRATTGTALIGLGWVLAPKLLSTDDNGNVFLDVAGHKMNIGVLSPMGNLIAIGARMRHEHDNGTLTPYSTAKIAGRTLIDQPLLRASSQISEAVRDPERSAGKFGASEAYSFVPFSGAVRGVGEMVDPADKRYPDMSFKEQLQRNFPVWRESLPMDSGRLFSKPNFIGNELERLGFKQGEVYKPSGIPEFDDRARQLMANRLEAMAEARSHNLGYKNASDARKRWILREDLRAIRKDVIDQVEGEMPEAARKLKVMRQSRVDRDLGIPPDSGGSSNPRSRPSALERPNARP